MAKTTKLLYLEDSYQRECKAVVKSFRGKNGIGEIILAETIFYPQGGGQPCDQGVIKGENGELKVTNVVYNNGNPIHQGKLKGRLKTGDNVTCTIDWNRRYKNMRAHSAGHLVHEAVHEVYPSLKPLRGEHGIGGKFFIQYQGETDIDLPKLNVRLMQLIQDDRRINTTFVSLAELNDKAQFVPENLPSNKPLRIVEIDGFSPVPDGGTQVRSTKELDGTRMTRAEIVEGQTVVRYEVHERTKQRAQKIEQKSHKASTLVLSIEDILDMKNNALSLVYSAQSAEELDQLRIKYLGRKGELNQLLQVLPTITIGLRLEYGGVLNDTKQAITLSINQRSKQLLFIPKPDSFFDPTIPGIKPLLGQIHPITKITNEVEDIFIRFGFSIATGPEVEWDEINFQKLLLGPDHPSRDTQETYYFDKKRLLRVHTSSVQIRYMETHKPPIRIISPGRVYRRDDIDATHLPSFHQIEGLLVDDKTTLTDLLGILEHAARQLFGSNRKVRFYGHHFPYTEPSLEVEVFTLNTVEGRSEKGEWLEILGCGMVHPQVLENCGIDSSKYQGWAFGMGADRLAMLKYNIDDIRQLYAADLKFLDP